MRPGLIYLAIACMLAGLGSFFLFKHPAGDPTNGGVNPKDQEKMDEGEDPEKVLSRVRPEWHGLLRAIAPSRATSEDWKKLNIQGGVLALHEGGIPYGIALNVLPLLEADKNINARFAQVSVERRQDGGIVTSIGSHKALKKLVIDWNRGFLDRESPKGFSGLEFWECLKEGVSTEEVSIAFSIPLEKSPRYIHLSVPDGGNGKKKQYKISYDHTGFTGASAFADISYVVAVKPKIRNKPHEFTSLMLFNIRAGNLIGEIDLPEGARDTRPIFALDKENNVLIATGYDLQWLMVIDLQDYVNKQAKRE